MVGNFNPFAQGKSGGARGNAGTPGTPGVGVVTGIIMAYAGVQPQITPDGWLYCNGDEYAKVDYPALGELCNGDYTQFGSPSDFDHFCVPDMRGRFPYNPPSPFENSIGSTGGEKDVTLVRENLPADSADVALAYYAPLPTSGNYGITPIEVDTGDFEGYAFTRMGISGGDTAHNNMPPYLQLSFIIKT